MFKSPLYSILLKKIIQFMIEHKTTWWYTMTLGGQDCSRFSVEGLYLALWLRGLGVPRVIPGIHPSFHWLSVVLVAITAWIMCYCVVVKTNLTVSWCGLVWADQRTTEIERVQRIELERSTFTNLFIENKNKYPLSNLSEPDTAWDCHTQCSTWLHRRMACLPFMVFFLSLATGTVCPFSRI